MPPRDARLRVDDILTAIGRIESYTTGMTFDAFAADQKTIDAVVRNFEVIGEAARHVDEPLAQRAPDSRPSSTRQSLIGVRAGL